MHHDVRYVATTRFLEPEQFAAFAIANRTKYHVGGSDVRPSISTFHVDALVEGFQATLGDDLEEHRRVQIEAAQARFRR